MPAALSPFRWLSPAGGRGRLSTFIFHRVLPQVDPMLPDEPDAEHFERIVVFLSAHFHLMHASEALAALARGVLPPAAACITFDDGYADNASVAVPILQRYGVPATFFVSTGYIDGGRMWNDTVIEAVRGAPDGEVDWTDLGLGRVHVATPQSRVAAYSAALRSLKHLEPSQRREITDEIARRAGLSTRSELMMTRAQVRQLCDAGMEVGGHTVMHPILARLNDAEAAAEICAGREQLAQWIGTPPQAFAYPNGVPGRDFSDRDVQLVRAAGYSGAFTTARGTAPVTADRYRIPRFTPWDRPMVRFGARAAMQLFTDRWAATAGAQG
jgi:peptidoglycan/xylan/chitin deacetylase (PgdA/CDA1 family)